MSAIPADLTLTPEQQDRIMSIHDSIMASLKQSLSAHEDAKRTIEAQTATLGERDATIADQAKQIEALKATAANAVDPGEVSAMLSQIDAASAGIRELVAPAPAAPAAA